VRRTLVSAAAVAVAVVSLGVDAGDAPARPLIQDTANDCRQLRAVFYTATDWLRLATKLAAAEAPCVEYYISIPPLAADKTQFRYAQPAQIHALGPNFHVLAEISTHGWGNWVAADGSRDWYQAGQEARRRMAAANFDVTNGDSWIVNEFSSAVVRGIGVARANMHQLVHGLYDGDGGPPVKGGVFTMLMLGLVTSSFPTYKAYLQDWYRDTPFWNDMAAYVSDWSQELYGDVRTYAVEGSSLLERREALDDYLQHELRLANAGPDEVGAARAFLRSAYSPLANAAWQYGSGFGWTAVPYEQMEDYVSAQTYALRSFAARSGQALDRFGFAWAPKSPDGMSSSDFAAQSGAIADRLAASIRDSAQSADLTDPGIGACVPAGENIWCTTTVAGSVFNPAWKTFTSWSPDALALLGAPAATAGQPVPLTAELQVAGIAWPHATPVTVTLASGSGSGELAPTVDGPRTQTLDLSLPAGSTDATFYYRDTSAGTAMLSVSAPGRVGATLSVTVGAAAADGVTATTSIVVAAPDRLLQTISFAALAARTYGDPDFAVDATASSGLPVTLSANGNCTASGVTIHLTGAGSCTVTATQPGDSNYSAAPAVMQTFAVAQATKPKQPSKCIVPKVVGKRLATAKRMIMHRHCRSGSTRYARSRKTKTGIVIAQSRRPGRVLPRNTKVALTIGRGTGR